MEMDFQGRAKNMAQEDLHLLLLMVLTLRQVVTTWRRRSLCTPFFSGRTFGLSL